MFRIERTELLVREPWTIFFSKVQKVEDNVADRSSSGSSSMKFKQKARLLGLLSCISV